MTSWPPMDQHGPHIDEARLSAFEQMIGAKFPEDYRAFMLELNGGATGPNVFAFDKNNKSSLNYLNSIDEENGALDLTASWERGQSWLPPELFPIGFDDGGAVLVLVLSGPRRGQVWFCTQERPTGSNPRVSWFDRRDVWKLAESFDGFLRSLTNQPESS